jgi:spore germination protein GerM
MVKQQREQRISVGVVAGIAAVAVTAGGGAAWWHWHSTQTSTVNTPETTRVKPTPSPSLSTEQKAAAYWLQDSGSSQKLVPTTITTTADQPSTALEAAFNSLLTGPKDQAVSTTIPEGTKLLGLRTEQDGVHVNLSKEFTTGGGSAAMTGRVAQVIYTATSMQPTAQVWIEVEGKPLEVLGGEGLELQQPLTRQSFQENFTL